MSERESKCTILFKITLKKKTNNNQTLQIKLTKEVKDLNSENYKTYKGN